MGFFGKIWDKAKDVGSNIWDGAKDKVKDWFDDYKNNSKQKALPPSKTAYNYGGNLVDSFAKNTQQAIKQTPQYENAVDYAKTN